MLRSIVLISYNTLNGIHDYKREISMKILMSKYKKSVRLKITLTIVLVSMLLACGVGDKESLTHVDGRVVKGVLSNAVVTIRIIDENGNAGEILGTARTTDEGRFSMSFAQDIYTPLLITAVTDSESIMQCDASNGCIDIDGTAVDYATAFTPSTGFTLKLIIPFLQPNEAHTVNMNVFAHLAAEYLIDAAANNGTVLDSNSAAMANSKITDLIQDYSFLQIGDSLLKTETIDITNKDEIISAIENNNASLLLGFASAAVMRYFKKNEIGDLNEALMSLSKLYQQNNGELPLSENEKGYSMEALLKDARDEALAVEIRYSDILLSSLLSTLDAAIDSAKAPSEIVLEVEKIVEVEKIIEKEVEVIVEKEVEVIVEKEVEVIVEKEVEVITNSKALEWLDDFIFDEIGAGKELVKAIRTFAYTVEDNAADIANRLIDGFGGEINAEKATEDFYSYVNFAKQAYPHVGQVIIAMMDFAENTDSPIASYDLAVDEKNKLPDDFTMTGIVHKTTIGGSVVLTLDNAFIENIGFIDLALRLQKDSFCSFCSTGYADVDLEVRAEQASILLNDYAMRIQRTWNGSLQRYIPSRLDMTDANVSIIIAPDADPQQRVTIRGESDVRLRLPYFNDKYFPILQSVATKGEFSQWGEDLRYFEGRLSYSNKNTYSSSFTSDPIRFAQQQAESFSVSAEFEADLRVPDENDYSSPHYKRVKVGLGMLTSTNQSPEARWVEISYDGEGFYFGYARDESNNYRFANKAGAIMEVILDENNKNLLDGFIRSGDKSIATIESSELGPIIRYSDGTIESF